MAEIRTVGDGKRARERPVVPYDDSMFMRFCEHGSRGDLRKSNFHVH